MGSFSNACNGIKKSPLLNAWLPWFGYERSGLLWYVGVVAQANFQIRSILFSNKIYSRFEYPIKNGISDYWQVLIWMVN
jgi:hypothetical protein